MKKSIFLCIFCLILQVNLSAQADQPGTMGIGAVSDSITVMITVGQPYSSNSFGFASLLNNSVDSLMCYNIGEIPDITVTPGIKTRFKIIWEDHKDATYNCTEVDYPYDSLIIRLTPSDYGFVFEYTPTDDVFEAFQLKLRAANQNDAVEQTVNFNPVQVLPQEYKNIAYACDSFLLDTIVVNKSVNFDTVYVIGSTVIFEDGKINNDALYYEGTSCKKLAVYATKLIVRDSVALPGCDLTIYCEDLNFGTNACFDIQPRQSTSRGENARNMHVYAKNFIAPGLDYRFRLRGGQGVDEIGGNKAMGGGNAGNFTSNLNLRKYVNLEGGYTGRPHDSITLGTKGKDGYYYSEPSQYGWLHPVMVRFALGNITNDYIHGLDDKVMKACQKYINVLDAYKKSNECDTSSTCSLDLIQLYNTFNAVLEKLQGGYDYFGNPKSWAPLLSFEANQTMYENEIDYAIRVLYLNYWITGISSTMKNKKSAANELISKNSDRVFELQKLFDKARADYSSQKDRFLADSKTLLELDKLLNAKLDSLYALTEKIIAKKNKWRGIVFSIGNVCSCIPGMNHYGSLMKGIAQMDYNDPFSSENLDVAYESLSGFIKDMTSKTEIVAGIYSSNPKLIADGSKELLQVSLDSLSPEVQKKRQELQKQLVMPIDEVEAKFNQLKAECPQIDELTDSMKILAFNKAKSWEDLAYTLNILNNTSADINQLINSNNALNDISNNNTFDERAISVINDMEKNAWTILRKYHYYLARAYQYRFLEPYDGDIDMQNIFEEISSIAKKDSGVLIPEDFEALKVIFEEPLKRITDQLFSKVNSGEYTGTNAPESYNLSLDELNTLNSKGEVTINLWESGNLPYNYADARITDFQFSNTDIDVLSDTVLSKAKLLILLRHSGKSMFINYENGLHYMFDQYNSEAGNTTNSLSPIGWGFSYDLKEKIVSTLTKSVSSQSLIKYMLGEKYSNDDILIYTLPSAWADITIRRVVNIGSSQASVNPVIKKLELKFNVDYEDIGKNSFANIVVRTNHGLSPVIQCNKADVNGFTHGRGNFTRTYPVNKSLQFTAPEIYGNYVFNKWYLTKDGIVTPYDANTINVLASKSSLLTLEYILAVPEIISPDTIWTDNNAQSLQFDIINNTPCVDIPMDWSITETCDWLSIDSGSENGTENGTVTLHLLENTGEKRTGNIHICAPNAINPFASTVVGQKLMTDINDVEAEDHQIKLKPNPASNQVSVVIAGIHSNQQINYSIIDMQGKQLVHGTEYINSEYTEFSINLEGLCDGMYLMVITTENKEMIREKLIINKKDSQN